MFCISTCSCTCFGLPFFTCFFVRVHLSVRRKLVRVQSTCPIVQVHVFKHVHGNYHIHVNVQYSVRVQCMFLNMLEFMYITIFIHKTRLRRIDVLFRRWTQNVDDVLKKVTLAPMPQRNSWRWRIESKWRVCGLKKINFYSMRSNIFETNSNV